MAYDLSFGRHFEDAFSTLHQVYLVPEEVPAMSCRPDGTMWNGAELSGLGPCIAQRCGST